MYVLSIRAGRIFILKEKPKCAKIWGAEFLEGQFNLLLFHGV